MFNKILSTELCVCYITESYLLWSQQTIIMLSIKNTCNKIKYKYQIYTSHVISHFVF